MKVWRCLSDVEIKNQEQHIRRCFSAVELNRLGILEMELSWRHVVQVLNVSQCSRKNVGSILELHVAGQLYLGYLDRVWDHTGWRVKDWTYICLTICWCSRFWFHFDGWQCLSTWAKITNQYLERETISWMNRLHGVIWLDTWCIVVSLPMFASHCCQKIFKFQFIWIL